MAGMSTNYFNLFITKLIDKNYKEFYTNVLFYLILRKISQKECNFSFPNLRNMIISTLSFDHKYFSNYITVLLNNNCSILNLLFIFNRIINFSLFNKLVNEFSK